MNWQLWFTPLLKFSLLSLISSLIGGFDLEEFSLIPDGYKLLSRVFAFPKVF
jgi:hypothetical protein